MANIIKRVGDQHQVDNNQSTDKSLLESILFLMTPDQREHFLKSSSPKGIVYANRLPCFDYPLSVLLTWKVIKQLAELYKTEDQAGSLKSQIDSDTQQHIEKLKVELEAGVRLSGARWYEGNDGKENTFVDIESDLFTMVCILQIEANDKALFKAIELKCHANSNNSKTRMKNDDYDLYEVSEFEEPVDIDVLDANEKIKNTTVSTKTNTKEFSPHIITTWHVYPPRSENMTYFGFEAIKKVVWEITNNRLLSGVYYWTRKHLKELSDIVNLSQLAMQYRYELIDVKETIEGRRCKLKVDGPPEDVTRMTLAYVYTEKNRAESSSINNYHNIGEMLKHRLRRPIVLAQKEYKRPFHLFDIVVGEEMPSEGFLVDVGSESQIKKQIEAMRCLAVPKSIVHLIKLVTLLGNVKVISDNYSYRPATIRISG